MSDCKKYYYLRLKENFFESDELILMESMPDGVLFSNILLKLYLRSLKSNGKLMLNERIPYNSKMLSNIVHQPVAVVEKAIAVFNQLGLIEMLDNGAIYMLDIQSFIGKSNTEADRKREYRVKIENEKLSINGTNNGQMSGQMSDERPPEIEIEKELDTEIEIELKKERKIEIEKSNTLSSKLDHSDIVTIIDYLNDMAGTHYRPHTNATISLIKARMNEGFTVEDFKTVIGKKCYEWKNDSQYAKFLRPQTLFGNKFESYLNQQQPVKQSNKQKAMNDLQELYNELGAK